jgi:hypothetical protein
VKEKFYAVLFLEGLEWTARETNRNEPRAYHIQSKTTCDDHERNGSAGDPAS